jgi:tRNA-Thr(GGU) m(6)t(6)A37 methyltransferase TsaA
MEIKFRPIGYVRTTATDEEIRDESHRVESVLEILPEFEDGLHGIDGFSHIIVMFYFHRLRPEQKGVLRVKPRRLLKFGLSLDELPELGVFSLDSPSRPNPIGLTIVRLLRREGRFLRVRGLDAFDGSPILDIKPYTPNRRIDEVKVPSWYERLTRLTDGREP